MSTRLRKKRWSRLARREALQGYLYISPWIAGFLIFSLGPILVSLYLSFTKYSVVSAPVFVGLDNYITAFTSDKLFGKAAWNTIYYAGLVVPMGIVGSLCCALLLNEQIKGRTAFRALFYMPSITPTVAMAVIWLWILQPEFGLFNYALSRVGIAGPRWFLSTAWVKPAIIMMSLWSSVGGSRMVIFLAGLQGIPVELQESAMIDGASAWQRFRHVTVPMLSPTIFMNLILAFIGAFRVFTTAYVTTGGGPSYASHFYMLHLFSNAFTYLRMGYAAALAWMLFLVVATLTYLQFRLSRRWVYYAGEH